MTATKPLCGQCQDGWVVDEETFLPVRRCECRHVEVTAKRARDEGMAATVDANRDAFKAALAIIRDAALSMPVLSANDVRSAMKIAQVPGEVVGAAFRQAAKDRLIRADSYIPSTDPETHMHPVRSWASLVYRGRTA